MPDLTQRLRVIRQSCELGPLTEGDLNKYWIDTLEARDPLSDVRAVLRARLDDRDDSKILFYGHGGSGKSTELNKLVRELEGSYLVVNFSVREEMSLTDVNSEDIILVLAERLVARAEAQALPIDAEALRGVYDYFATITETQTESDARAGKIEAGAEVKTPSILSGLVHLFAGFKAEVRYEARNENSRVARIRKRPGDLLNWANLLINAVRLALPANHRLLFIVEDLDKLDIATARQVFIDHTNILTGLNANIIYTIPIFTFHSPDARILHTQFQQPVSLPMIKVTSPDGTRAAGFEITREIITRRLGPQALSDAAMDLLIEKTGGVLQHAFEVIIAATLMRNATVPLQADHIRYSLNRKKADLRTEITLPYEPVPGLERREQLYERLRQCRDRQRAGKPESPSGQVIDQVLLKSCALVEYNGERWLGVHPLVAEILDEIA